MFGLGYNDTAETRRSLSEKYKKFHDFVVLLIQSAVLISGAITAIGFTGSRTLRIFLFLFGASLIVHFTLQTHKFADWIISFFRDESQPYGRLFGGVFALVAGMVALAMILLVLQLSDLFTAMSLRSLTKA